jgi:hypoxanthine phosphoribosyltransferase
MITFGEFRSHSGILLPWKLECDDLSDNDIRGLAAIIASKFYFRGVHGVPRGGIRLANALQRYTVSHSNYPLLIVDDVMTTGTSMEETKKKLGKIANNAYGVVLFSRTNVIPNWIFPLFIVGYEFR